nr:immunoglobulin heavy chain junction region [Mus musculus]
CAIYYGNYVGVFDYW